MAFSQEQIEYYHNKGQMPDWIYYQLSDKDPQTKWQEQHQKMYDRLREQEEESRHQKELEKMVEQKLDEAVEKALADILKNLSL